MKKDSLLDNGHRDVQQTVRQSRRRLLASASIVATASGIGFPMVARAQSAYPAKPIKMIVPWPPGQATDLGGRALALGLARVLGQSVVVENKAGAGGMIGTDMVAKSPGDGYTVLAASSGPVTVSPLLQPTAYNPDADLVPVSMMGLSPYVLVTAPDFPAKDAAQLVKMIKDNPGKYTFASSGTGATAHLIAESFNSALGLKAVHVPYKGSVPALTDVVSGRVTYCLETAASTMPFVRDGRAKAYGVSLLKGSVVTPGIPPLATAAGIPGFDLGAWLGVMVPRGTPAEIVAKLDDAVKMTMQSQDVIEIFLRIAVENDYRSTEDFKRYLKDITKQFADVIKQNDIKIEKT
ncbi:tripartite tricarboxylate transporter substrate binding protein [Orrella sp. NBD-18]|uniref:Tripartite tricarboxylate transporter substrate binding protein n=1 Tax=Sheuella amnicola TaxID=2707330 RepID=A0A6B2R1M8_9BURK|nr:tripartite tricarboxylate transporter substrate binding protein [Sheuella amnicola]NDY83998.1 tripartite tricarboxylate transporter substrate binding protein [Sheuella amnicola]